MDPVKDPIESSRGAPDEAFARSAVVLVREFVQSRYKDYGKGEGEKKGLEHDGLLIGDATSSEEPHRVKEWPISHLRGLRSVH